MSLWLSQNYKKSISGCAPRTINQRTGIAYFWCAGRTLHFCWLLATFPGSFKLQEISGEPQK
jgi:hypothetical protein